MNPKRKLFLQQVCNKLFLPCLSFTDSKALSLLVATGGDDNALAVSTLQICFAQHQQQQDDVEQNDKKLEFKLTDTKSRNDAHVSSITGNLFQYME